MRLLARIFGGVLPRARRELERWTEAARVIPDPHLRSQALASLRFKRFHALGASVFGAVARPMDAFIRFAVAYQTISDYLDNLADRDRVPGAGREADLTLLHRAMIEAVNPGPPAGGYYRFHTATDDGGYLPALVATCREALVALGAARLAPRLLPLAGRYARMQALKHLQPHRRAAALMSWAQPEATAWSDLLWWEFAASAGSTLGIFALAASTWAPEDELDRLEAAYVPWVTAYHILLDYLIDLEEDRAGGDFNFVACYPSPDVAARRLRTLAGEARGRIEALGAPAFHRLVVHGLTGLYLADAKAGLPVVRPVATSLLSDAGREARALAWLCRWRNPFGQVAEPQPPPVG